MKEEQIATQMTRILSQSLGEIIKLEERNPSLKARMILVKEEEMLIEKVLVRML